MEYRTLGSTGPSSSAVGLGCLPLAGAYGLIAETDAVGIIHRATESGITFLDTADFYGGGEVERSVGKAIADRREQVLLCTRGGAVFTSGARPTSLDGSPEYLRGACADSLDRLGVDHIDLYLLARVDPAVPVEDSIGALAELVDAGKVRHIGVCEPTAEELRRAHRVHPLTAVECEYSLWERKFESDVLALCGELDIGFIAHSPLGRGFLTGGLRSAQQLGPRDFRRRQPRFAEESLRTASAKLAVAEKMALDKGISLASLAIAWLLARGEHIVPIPGTRNPAHLLDNVAAVDIALTADECALLAEVLA